MRIFLILTIFFVVSCSKPAQVEVETAAEGPVAFWLTTGDKSHLLEQQKDLQWSEASDKDIPRIMVNVDETFQPVDGFGFALTGGSADVIQTKLSPEKKAALLQELFSNAGIGISYLRVSIGASDLDDHVFTYADLPPGKTDESLASFSLEEDQENLIPLLKEILAINPDIKIMGSPWTAPVWMKSNKLPKGGSLLPEYYPSYALYFVKYIQAMAAEGITIDAITVQNEPENPKNTPSLVMTAEEQRDFIKNHLGPAFEKADIKTRIVLFDHNCDHPEYPISIMNDPEAKKYVDGSAFHLYLGEIDALSKVHDAHPDRNLYFTEQWTWSKGDFDGDLRWHTRHLTVGAMRNWSRNVLEWNLASDPNFDPHTDDGGCSECMGALTIGDNSVSRNVSYYIIAHASKFVRPGAVRIGSTIADNLYNVAFRTPEGKAVVLVVNDNDTEKTFAIGVDGKEVKATLAAGAVGTFVWK